MPPTKSEPWRVSLHGGHSGDYCDHAEGSLREILDAAAAAGMHAYGITEHAPRSQTRYLYAEEVAMGWDVAHLARRFARYAREVETLRAEYAGRIAVLKGFEAEVVPPDSYAGEMLALKAEGGFDYIVGSVHYVGGVIIDYTQEQFARAAADCGGVAALAERYYETMTEMIDRLRPEVVGHFDLIRRNAPDEASVSGPRVRDAAFRALDAAAACGAILDVNTGGYRKGLGRPYPAPWIVEAALARGVEFCFGDDSHRPEEAGAGIEEARDYLLALGVTRITALERTGAGIARRAIPLAAPADAP